MLNYFDKLFSDYKNIYSQYNNSLPILDLPPREKTILAIATLLLIKVFFTPQTSFIVTVLDIVFSIALFFCVTKSKKNAQQASVLRKEEALINLLMKYGIEYTNLSKMQSLIAYTKDRINRRDPFLLIKKAISIVVVTTPVATQIITSISAGTLTPSTVLTLFCQIMLMFVVLTILLIAIWYILDPIIYRERTIGQSLIDDLTELTFFNIQP